MVATGMTRIETDNRLKQIVWGAGIVLVIAVAVCGTLVGWRHLPGILGEWIGTMVGVMTTPFFLEASFAVIGLCVVLALNHWRMRKSGDELVYLERVDGPDLPPDLPDHAKWAVFRDEPLPGEVPSLQAQAEGAMAIGDHVQAGECIAAMGAEELKQPGALAVRLALAKATGRDRLAGELERELKSLNSK